MDKITIDDLKKLNILVGTVESIEDIEGSEKLYNFLIDIGAEKRQIVGGLKPSYLKEDLLNKQVLILENLEPRNLMSVESQGMILAASDGDGKPVIIQPQKAVPNGTSIK